MNDQSSEQDAEPLVLLSELHLCPEVAPLLASRASTEWEARARRVHYVTAGALLLIRGRWHARPGRFRRVCLDIAHERAVASCAKSEAAH